ncbi:hypothetical protein [Haloactinomyces albus]|uniref:Integrase n=1 Tax=Haloactinomyces albus TaxID=1352928 RepID=A0AAE4CP86_9ACTN|nr:hypothetical protein [Haloactinomyces albus]MDR7304629.1 integrase [Haloactinomyces albus]
MLDEETSVERLGRWFADRWGKSAAATANARLDALRSAAAWWRMLYETAARAEEVLALDVDELDLRNRRARVPP